MKTLHLIIALLLTAACAQAQDDLVIPDLHGDKESIVHIKNKTMRKEIASFTVTGEDENKSGVRLKKIPVYRSAPQSATFRKDSIEVTITTNEFIKSRHKIEYINNSYAIKIDGQPFWGTDGGLPQNGIQSVKVIMGKDTIAIPQSQLKNLYNPNLCGTISNGKASCMSDVYLSADGKRLYIYMMNSDGAGSYEVTWVISNKKFLRRFVDYGF